MAFQTILYSVDEAIATIALNRPDKLNAMNNQLIAELDEALVRAEADVEVRVIIDRKSTRLNSSHT